MKRALNIDCAKLIDKITELIFTRQVEYSPLSVTYTVLEVLIDEIEEFK